MTELSVFQVGSFIVTILQYFFLDPLTASVGSDWGRGALWAERRKVYADKSKKQIEAMSVQVWLKSVQEHRKTLHVRKFTFEE